jgi:hypothetical protein
MQFTALILTQMRRASGTFTSFLLDLRPKSNSAWSHFAPNLPLASIQRHVIVVFLAKAGQVKPHLGQLFGSIPILYRLSPLVLRTKEARCPLHLT